MRFLLMGVVAALCFGEFAWAQEAPRIERFSSEDGAQIEVHVFETAPSDAPRPAAVLLHGGGWVAGDASWVYPRAQHFAELGVVSIALEYRLSNQTDITPAHAAGDVRAAFRWLRANAERLNIDPQRIFAYGVSAGGHLSALAAEADDPLARPNLLVLISPALDVERDNWFIRLSGESTRALSPLANVRVGMPPVFILQGDVDTLTPLSGARAFCERMQAASGDCGIRVFEGYGHLFTPAGLNDQDVPQPDPATSRAAAAEADAYLRSRGYLR